MSRVGKVPVKIQKGVKVAFKDGVLKVEGPKGKLSHQIPEGVRLNITNEEITVERATSELGALQGTTRTVVHNLVKGCAEGFNREMDIVGVGYRAAVKGKVLNLTLGFSHPVDFPLPEGITAKVTNNTHLTISGADKILLGEVAAKIRGFRPPEPYQGKGVRYSDERIVKKAGKAAAGAGAK